MSTDSEDLRGGDSWPPRVRANINALAADERGRTLFCRDIELDEVIAALGFTLDGPSTQPLLAYAFALRREPELRAISCGGGWVVYLDHIGALLGRPAAILYRSPQGEPADYARRSLGFRKAPRYPSIRAGGELLIQDPVEP